MDRPTTGTDAHAQGSRLNPHEAFVLPSRRPALDLCRATLRTEAVTGPILVTGDAGVGKTWLWRRLESESPPSRRWIGVDLTPANDPGDFYRLIAHELGLLDPGSKASDVSRVGLVDFLAARHADEERITLVVEEAHNLSAALWEEVRVLTNRLGRPGGFSAIVLVGQTSLARKLATRPFAPIEARLAAKVHLGPIDADEAKEWLARLRPGREWPIDEVEVLHRDGAGNPRRMLRRLGPVAGLRSGRTPGSPCRPDRDRGPTSPRSSQPPASPASPMPLTGPVKPPIRVEENMIEVGWSPDDAPSPEDPAPSGRARSGDLDLAAGEEAVRDHYAALQAWREWSENQAAEPPRPPDGPTRIRGDRPRRGRGRRGRGGRRSSPPRPIGRRSGPRASRSSPRSASSSRGWRRPASPNNPTTRDPLDERGSPPTAKSRCRLDVDSVLPWPLPFPRRGARRRRRHLLSPRPGRGLPDRGSTGVAPAPGPSDDARIPTYDAIERIGEMD